MTLRRSVTAGDDTGKPGNGDIQKADEDHEHLAIR
jgi:hypothetical protein